MGRVQEKVVLVTGDSKGMGEAHARAFLAEDVKFVVCDLLHEECESLARELIHAILRSSVTFRFLIGN